MECRRLSLTRLQVWFFQMHRAHELAAEVVRLLNDPQRLVAMSRSGQERAREKFSSAHVAGIVAEAIQKLPIHPNVDRHPTTEYRPGLLEAG